ncbi:MAG: hypothetical protein JWQ69_4492 [Pseudomonas sp.]|nr:hypothetical protein [Pseudomonas sp.]
MISELKRFFTNDIKITSLCRQRSPTLELLQISLGKGVWDSPDKS